MPAGGLPGQVYRVSPNGDSYGWSSSRIRVYSDLDIYVRTDGDDNNDGLENTPDRALATISKAINKSLDYDGAGYNVFIRVAKGTYNEGDLGVYPYHLANWRAFSIIGESREETIVRANEGPAVFYIFEGGRLRIGNITADVSGNSGYYAGHNGCLDLMNCGVSGNGYNLVNVGGMGLVRITVGLKAVGSFMYGIGAVSPGGIMVMAGEHQINCSFSHYFACANRQGWISIEKAANTFNGSSTGARYYAGSLSCIQTDGAPADFLPGNKAGTVNTSVYGLLL